MAGGSNRRWPLPTPSRNPASSGAVSPIGATGLLQVRPGTASDMARAAGLAYSQASLSDPRYNLEYGQSFIERLRASGATRAQLPKVIASYNAGPVPVARWASIQDNGDPLLWIESIPYWETRYYVPAVMRNLWVYEGLAGKTGDVAERNGAAPLAGLPDTALIGRAGRRRPLRSTGFNSPPSFPL